jgi:HAE1 family hydrophobic/amphiphilic exporter-1
MIMAALILFGGISFFRMGVSQMPDVDFPVVNISITDQGAAPEVMETQIVDVIEDAVMTVEGVKHVSSTSREGSANITVELNLNRNIDVALEEVQTKVSQAQRLLPTNMDPPVITKTNPEDQPIIWLALTANDPSVRPRDLMIYVRDVLNDRFTSVSGVGDIRLGGYLDPNLRIWVDGDAMTRNQLSANDIVSAINNEHVELPSGLIESGATNANVRTLGEADTVKEFEDILVNTRGGQPNYAPFPLKRVARIEEGMADVTRISRSNGLPAVGLGIIKQRGTNAVEVANNVKQRMEEVKKNLPPGYGLGIRVDTTRFIENSVHELNKNLILSAIATSLVCWLFLGSWTSTLNILLAIPTSIVGAFTFLYFAGFTLNTFTLLGLSLAIGVVVDDAIMVLENIIRHQEMGKHRILAASDGAREVTFAAIATTLAIVAIFLPVAFMSGIVGKYLFQFGVTMTATVLLSLMEALTLTPMRCSQFVTIGSRSSGLEKIVATIFSFSSNLYKRLLGGALRFRWVVVVIAFLFFIASISLIYVLRTEFVPSQDQSMYLVSLTTSVDSSLDTTDAKYKEAEKVLLSRPEIEGYYSTVGGYQGGQLNTGNIFVNLKPKGKRGIDPDAKHELSQLESMAAVRKIFSKISGVRVSLRDLSTGGFAVSRGYPIELGVHGQDWDTLTDATGKLQAAMAKSPYLTDLDTDYQNGMPEVDVIPDRDKATRHGVSVEAIAQAVDFLVGGEKIGQYPRGEHRDDIRIRLVANQRTKADQINHLYVRNNRGELVPLSDVVNLVSKPSLQQISRVDRQRTISLFANVAKGKSQTDAMADVQRLAKQILPPGYNVVFTGSSETFSESFKDLAFAMFLGVLVAYMILASQFNSYIDPVSVLVALPFSISGAFFGLWLFGQSLNIYSFIGLILLMGIVKKNSIMLVDFTNQIRKRDKKSVHDALLEAAPIRFRPILMTSFACIAAAIPEAFSKGAGAETQIPMGVVIIFGMFVSTFLTLFVVPCFYSIVAPLEGRHAHEDLLAEVFAGQTPNKTP